MSGTRQSPSRLPNLEQQRKRAKELLRAHRRQEPLAHQRIARRLPRLSGLSPHEVAHQRLTLSETQLVVAREAGFDSWPRMKQAVEEASGRAARLDLLIRSAVNGNDQRVRTLIQSDPQLPQGSLPAAAALADDESAQRLLERSPQLAKLSAGPLGWTPILYACCSRFGRLDPPVAARRRRIVKQLLKRDADPNESCPAPDLTGGTRSVLAGAVEFAGDLELLEILLKAGANPKDGPALWAAAGLKNEHALGCLKILLRGHPPAWQLHCALSLRLDQNDIEGARLLIEQGADPNASGGWGRTGTLLHHAIWKGCRRPVLELLIEHGADPQRPDRDGRTPYQAAVRCGHQEAIALLQDMGGAELDALDRLLAECIAARKQEAGGRRRERRPDSLEFLRTDHQMLPWAVRQGRFEAVRPLLEAGLDPAVPDDDGETALHAAAALGHLPSVEILLQGGASASVRNHSGQTPLDLALALPDQRQRRLIADRLLEAGAPVEGLQNFPCGDAQLDQALRRAGAVQSDDLNQSFEKAAEAVVSGDAKTLRSLLDEHPQLIQARSRRPHKATLLHYLAANGVESDRQRTPANAVEIGRMLLDAGAEPDALCATYGGGPAQTTLSLLVSSDWPEKAGLQGELVRLLCRSGAKPDGLDNDGVPLATAIAFRKPQAVAALADLGARLDNPLFAAAAGRLDLLRRHIGDDGCLRPGAGHCRVPWLHMSRHPKVAAQQALLHAAQFGHLELVRFLAERGVDLTAAPVDGITALHEASLMGHLEVVRYLLDQGADAAAREKRWGASAFGWAQEGKQQAVLDLLCRRTQPDIYDAVELNLPRHVRRLLDDDPDLVHAPDGQGAPLRIAAAEGHFEMVQLLLERGADPRPGSLQGQSALDLARSRGHTKIVGLLKRL